MGTEHVLGKGSLVSTQPQAVATIVLNKRRKNWPYLGGIKQLISRLFMTRGELAIITSSWKMPRLTKQICNRAQNIQQMLGKAMQQVILLRRCFFPRRDVIKWSAKLGDKYAVSEVVLVGSKDASNPPQQFYTRD